MRSSQLLSGETLSDARLVRHGSKVGHQLASLAVPGLSRLWMLLRVVVELLKVVELCDRRRPVVVSRCVLASEHLRHVEVLRCADGSVAATLCQSRPVELGPGLLVRISTPRTCQ